MIQDTLKKMMGDKHSSKSIQQKEYPICLAFTWAQYLAGYQTLPAVNPFATQSMGQCQFFFGGLLLVCVTVNLYNRTLKNLKKKTHKQNRKNE